MKLQVMETMDYNLFSTFKGNRNVNQLHVARIVRSMQEQFLIKPIDVNNKYEIIDGQHRFEACKQLNKPIYYLIHNGWGMREAQRLNANQKNWTTEEYLKGYCDLKYNEYIKFKVLKDTYTEFNFTVLLSVAIGLDEKPGGSYLSDFKNGFFVYKSEQEAERKLQKLRMIKPYFDKYNTTTFAWAIFSALKNNDFNFQEFLTKLSYQSTKLVDCTTTKQYLMSIEDIYNYRRRGDNIRLF